MLDALPQSMLRAVDEARLAEAAADVDGGLALEGVGPVASVLHLGCGPGRVSLELARRGFRVTAVDRTACYLERGRARARAEGLNIGWVQDDMRRFERRGAFDLVLSLFTTFGFFAADAEEQSVARHMAECLRPGGKAVLEMAGQEVIARTFQARSWLSGPGVEVLEERSIRPGFGWVDTRWIVHREGVRREHAISLRLYSGVELSRLLREVGFSRVELFGSLAGGPYDNQATRLVAVATR